MGVCQQGEGLCLPGEGLPAPYPRGRKAVGTHPIGMLSLLSKMVAHESTNFVIICRADTGFSVGWGANHPGRGRRTYYFAKFSEKLHEIEKSLDRRGGGVRMPGAPPLDPPMRCLGFTFNVLTCTFLYDYVMNMGM